MIERLVIDANVFASALIKPIGVPGQILSKLISSEKHQILLTPDILQELDRILFYPKVRKYISFSDREIKNWLEAVALVSHFITPRYLYSPIVIDDPDDDIYVIAALEGQAKKILSGDKHLLKLDGFKGLSVVSPKTYGETFLK